MKLKKFAVLLVFVMVLGVCGAAFAEYRTGSDVGDAVMYGAGGAVIGASSSVATASVGASLAAGAIVLACPAAGAVGVAAGTGALIYGAYGYFEPNKTLKRDAAFAMVTAVAAPFASTYIPQEKFIEAATSVTKNALGGFVLTRLNDYKIENETVDLKNPYQASFADWAY